MLGGVLGATARGPGKVGDLRILTEEAHRRREVREVKEAHGKGRKLGFRGREKRLCMSPDYRVPAVVGGSRGMHTVRTSFNSLQPPDKEGVTSTCSHFTAEGDEDTGSGSSFSKIT